MHAFVDLGVIYSSIDDVLFYDAKGKSRFTCSFTDLGKGVNNGFSI